MEFRGARGAILDFTGAILEFSSFPNFSFLQTNLFELRSIGYLYQNCAHDDEVYQVLGLAKPDKPPMFEKTSKHP